MSRHKKRLVKREGGVEPRTGDWRSGTKEKQVGGCLEPPLASELLNTIQYFEFFFAFPLKIKVAYLHL